MILLEIKANTGGMASLRTQWQYVEAHYPVNEDANAWPGHLNGSKGKLTWFYKRCDDLQNEAMNAIEEETWFDDSCEREIEGNFNQKTIVVTQS